ncbi:MAG: PIG-L family deacetylase [Planctomycetes bacterium]|nr:PIG-L family deacetylase [Planctomycetota bacterium]
MWKHILDCSPDGPLLPRVVLSPPAGRTLVLAPHPDDETFGMGGTVRLHVEQGDRVDVVFLTDGGFGDPDGVFADRDYPALRRAEAQAAAAVLGVSETVFYGYPDRYPAISEEALDDLAGRLAAEIRARNPTNLYFPWPGECHPDHWAAARATLRALAQLSVELRVLGYEVWSALVPDFIVDVTGTRALKIEAGRCYASQLHYAPYFPIMEGLMAYRSLHFRLRPGDPPRWGEAFVEIQRA